MSVGKQRILWVAIVSLILVATVRRYEDRLESSQAHQQSRMSAAAFRIERLLNRTCGDHTIGNPLEGVGPHLSRARTTFDLYTLLQTGFWAHVRRSMVACVGLAKGDRAAENFRDFCSAQLQDANLAAQMVPTGNQRTLLYARAWRTCRGAYNETMHGESLIVRWIRDKYVD